MPKQPRSNKSAERQSYRPAHRSSSRQPSAVQFNKLYGANYLDISQYDDTTHSERGKLQERLAILQNAFWSKRALIAMTGAGISVNAGIPDFRTICDGKPSTEVLDMSVYDSDESTEQFHEMCIELFNKATKAQPTVFHHFLSDLCKNGRPGRLHLRRHITQNFDCLETKLSSLSPDEKPGKGLFPATLQLHGRIDQMICQTCKYCLPFNPQLFHRHEMPLCPECVKSEDQRQQSALKERLRLPSSIGVLRPNMTLYGDYEKLDISRVIDKDLLKRSPPDCVLIAGTRLKIAKFARLARTVCRAAKSWSLEGAEGLVIYVNKEQRSFGPALDSLIDFRVQGDCDMLASLLLANGKARY